jgi:hypothetical protein
LEIEKGVSVTAGVAVGSRWKLVFQARRPGTRVKEAEALQSEAEPGGVPPGVVDAMSSTTPDVGCWPVRVAPSNKLAIERDSSAFGVTSHEQQLSNSSFGSNA